MGIYLEGTFTYLVDVEEKYFPYVIEWRNNPENNRFLNQPFLLTMEKQRAWYEKYRADDTQGLLMMVAKDGDIPFGTNGWTDYDPYEKHCISGRILVGDYRYRGSVELVEGMLLHLRYLYETLGVERDYSHVVVENKKSQSHNKRLGFRKSDGEVKFPHELFVNGMHQVEMVRDRAGYRRAEAYLSSLLEVFIREKESMGGRSS